MPPAAPSPTAPPAHGMPFAEFVALMASIMAVNALGIDMMLPALGAIGRDLSITVENHQQLIIATYVGCFGLGQLFWGPLADRFGRRPILLGAMIVYAVTSVLAAHAGTIELMLLARGVQGGCAASSRVLNTSIIRDCYSGRTMARVMSLSMMVFMAVPILAPVLGQLIMVVAPWRWIFYVLGAFSLSVALWAWIRLPETLDPARRRPISVRSILDGFRQVATNRYSVGYAIGFGCLYGLLLSFLYSSGQILLHTFGAPQLFTLCFATITAFLAAAALLNSHIVERFGMRMISHVALLALILTCAIRLVIELTGHETLLIFTLLGGVSFFFYGLTGSNFGAMAMEPMANIAGTAASVQGFTQTTIGTCVGLFVGQSFQGTTLPLHIGGLALTLISLGAVLIVERGRLFHAHNRPPA